MRKTKSGTKKRRKPALTKPPVQTQGCEGPQAPKHRCPRQRREASLIGPSTAAKWESLSELLLLFTTPRERRSQRRRRRLDAEMAVLRCDSARHPLKTAMPHCKGSGMILTRITSDPHEDHVGPPRESAPPAAR
jgi:hypothetical protein